MKTIEEIDVVNEHLNFEDFSTLFKDLPLTKEERLELVDYFKMYKTFLGSGVNPENSWVATKNLYVIKNPQISERINCD